MIITIDGPTASGKSSTARTLAKRLDFYHLNSGLLYRAFAYVLLKQKNYTYKELKKVVDSDVYSYLTPEYIQYKWDTDGVVHVTIDVYEITQFLKDTDIAQAASIISLNKLVRNQVGEYVNLLAKDNNIVADGRDCGSILFPTAELKIFLTASVEVRAKRWQQEHSHNSTHLSFEQAQAQIIERDTRDSTRTIAPLIKPIGAMVIDNSYLSMSEVIEKIVARVNAIRSH